MMLAETFYNLHVAGVAEERRVQSYQAMAQAFSQVDFIMCATNPGPAFPADKTNSSPERTPLDILGAEHSSRPRRPQRTEGRCGSHRASPHAYRTRSSTS